MKPRLLLSIRRGLKRLQLGEHVTLQSGQRPRPADTAWHEMLRRLDREDAERRLEAMERALNTSADR